MVVEFSPGDLGLTDIQEMKLKKLAGSRYNPTKETVKMSCESFEHQAQNKRYLAELVQKLVADAKVRIPNHIQIRVLFPAPVEGSNADTPTTYRIPPIRLKTFHSI